MKKENQNVTYKEVQFVLAIILVLNLIVAVLKIILGYSIYSSAMVADGFHSLSDGGSNVIGLVGIQFSKKPADETHPYGHQKIEMLSSSFIGLLVAFLGIKIFYKGILLFKNPVVPRISLEALLVLVFTLVLNLGITLWENKKGKKLKSPILVSDARHTRSDVYISMGVLVSLIALKLGLPYYIDALTSCILAVFILHTAWEILRDNIDVLLDGKVLDEGKLRKVVLEFAEVKGVHKIRTRGSLAHVYADFHILVRGNMTVDEAHELSHKIEKKLEKVFDIEIQALVHIEPYIHKLNKKR